MKIGVRWMHFAVILGC